MTDKMEENDMGRKKQISDQKHLHRERMRLQKGVFSSLANAVGNIGELYADFVQSDEVRNSMKATADKAIECMDNIKELNELEEQLKAPLYISGEPEIVGALGAALYGLERVL